MTGIGPQISFSDTSSKEEEKREKENLKYREWMLRDLELFNPVEEETAFGD